MTLIAGTGGLAAAGAGYRFFSGRNRTGGGHASPDGPEFSGLKTARRTSHALGAKVSMLALHEDQDVATKALDAAFRELGLVADLMSLYRPNSLIRRLNREGVVQNPHPYFVAVVQHAQALSETSHGAFDVTVQPLWELYAKAKEQGRLPDASAIDEVLRKVDWRKLQVSNREIRLLGDDMGLTLNGIAQGFAGDKALAALRSHGVTNALVDTGEIGALGRKVTGEPWTVGIQHPRQPDAFLDLARIDDGCIATSGDYVTTFSPDRADNHLFDPRTGRSPQAFSSVTVVARTGMAADALSTAVFVLGAEAGLKLLNATPGAEAMLVFKDGDTLTTQGFPAAQRT